MDAAKGKDEQPVLESYRIYEGKPLRRGFTTGMAAAGAAKAAALVLFGHDPFDQVKVVTPLGIELYLSLSQWEVGPDWVRCCVIKDGGDDPDVTHGTPICALVRRLPEEGVRLRGGKGVGQVTKPGLAVPVGEPAINPVPRQVILQEVQGILPPGAGIEVVIEVPEGETLAKKTLNPKLGIVGGISILGTTGIVEPMSEEAYRRSLEPQIDQAIKMGFSTLVMTPGHLGEKWATRSGIPAEAIVQMSNFVGHMLTEGLRRGLKGVLLWGHHGKLVKVAGGIFHTHSRIADARAEIIAAYAARLGAPAQLVEAILASPTAEGTVELLESAGLSSVFDLLAERASQRAREYVHEEMTIGTILLSLQGKILGTDREGRQILTALARVNPHAASGTTRG
ncbi:MAG: cobalt-precorrin-5B (C(1))-methyltransferase CbiD [Firmicutes bacterium]|nr:cobalt-precorrin-5B (C(1))-methyltransferase CbiD [Bacillota bacterium]